MPQISPGGLGVDYLRSCYRTTMRFSADPDAPLVPIRWKRCAPGTPTIPFPTPFVSRIWDANQAVDLPEALGEVGPRVWDDGGPTTRQWRPGFVGSEAQWRDGLRYPDDWGEPGVGGVTPWACPGFDPLAPWRCADIADVWRITDVLFPGWPTDYIPGPVFLSEIDGPCDWSGLVPPGVIDLFHLTEALASVGSDGSLTVEIVSVNTSRTIFVTKAVYRGWTRPGPPQELRLDPGMSDLHGYTVPETITVLWQRL